MLLFLLGFVSGWIGLKVAIHFKRYFHYLQLGIFGKGRPNGGYLNYLKIELKSIRLI